MESIIACKTCGLLQRFEALQPGTAAECFRCGSDGGVKLYQDGERPIATMVSVSLALNLLLLYVLLVR